MNPFRALILALAVGVFSVAALSGIAFVAHLATPCCGVLSVDAVKGAATIRNHFTGRIMQINSADVAKTLKVGDELDANPAMSQIVSVKGVAKTVSLQEPDGIEPCCNVVAIVKDQAAVQALLGGVFAEPVGNPAEPVGKPGTNPAEPVGALRGKIKSVDAVNGMRADFGNELNGAEPVGGLIVARNITTGALHVLNTSVLDQGTMGSTASPITGAVKIGDPVSVDAVNGFATLKSQGGTYAFKLRGVKRGAEPVGAAKGPWVVEPDPKAEGQYGIVRTNWHEKVGSGYERIYVYLPGKRDKEEYNENWKTEHSVMVGEYDVFINGMLLEKVPVKPGHATRILLGALRSTAKFENQLHILDSKDRKVNDIQGGEVIALPVGTYHLKVGTRTINIEIKENEVTDF